MFSIQIADGQKKEFEYIENDPIFELADVSDDPVANQNAFCNCCEKRYKSYKETKYCQFCALAYCGSCRFKTRKFPKSKELARGDICKVCDRKFFIKELLGVNQAKIDNIGEQLFGKNGHQAQIEQARKDIYDKQQQFENVRDLYKKDYQKVKLLLTKLTYKSNDLVKNTHKLQKENEDLIEKQRRTEDHMKDINEQTSKYQYEYKMLPEQYDNLNNHFLISQQEARQLQIQI